MEWKWISNILFKKHYYKCVVVCFKNLLKKQTKSENHDICHDAIILRTCVVRGPVDGRSSVRWVIDNVVWTDSRLSIARACCDLIGVGAGEEQAQKDYASGPPGVERQVGSVRGIRWPTGSCAVHMVAKTARWSRVQSLGWASKPRPSWENRGGQVMSGDWREAAPNPWGLKWFTTMGYLAEPQNQDRRPNVHDYSTRTVWAVGAGLTSEEHWSNWCALWAASGDFEAKDTRYSRMGCVGATQTCGGCASVRWCYDKISQSSLRGCVS
jgi:hypothetical protein